MNYKIIGDDLPILEISVQSGEKIIAEAGPMVYKSANIEMKAHAKGGFWKSVRRTLAHESLFLTEFATTNGTGTIGFASEALGRIRAVKLDPGQEIILQKDAFIASEATVDLDWKWARLKTGLFGGEGFILKKITGPGTVFIGAFGDFRDFNLAIGEKLDVDTGCLVAFDKSIKYDVHLVKGIKTILFGGEGLFLANMEGPGRVIIQSMNRYEVARYLIQAIGYPATKAGAAGFLLGTAFRIGARR